MPPSDPLDDPLRNAWVGCLWPVVRNFILTALAFAAAFIVWLTTFSWFLALITLIGLTAVHGLIWRSARAREKAASARFWGIDQ